MKEFIKKIAIILFLPFLIVLYLSILFVERDIYYDFKSYKNYSWKYNFQSLGDISTKKLLRSEKNYNTFIFGSSRTVSIYACYVQKRIKNSEAFHYGSWNETIGGIFEKMKLLDSLGYNLRNIIIYLDTDYTFAGDGMPKSYDHYLFTHTNKFRSYFDHYQSYFSGMDLDKFKILLGYKVEGPIFPNWESDLKTNDYCHCTDSLVKVYGERDFTKEYEHKIDSLKRIGFLFQRSKVQEYKERQISISETALLNKIKMILEKHHSNYFIIVTPLYDQLKFNKIDLQILTNTFGNNLYDFSGINRFTADEQNYPDRIHFVQYVSKQIIDSVLKPIN